MQLIVPSEAYLPGYKDALQRGWSPNNERGLAAALDELAQIEANPAAFLALLDDREGKGPPVPTPDGSFVPRLPGFRRWMWDGEFCGSIGLRWQRGTEALPPHCPGHVGYAVVPWKRRRGYATAALRAILPEARAEGLARVEITTEPDNVASQRVIEANGGVLVERYRRPPQLGGTPALRYRVDLAPRA